MNIFENAKSVLTRMGKSNGACVVASAVAGACSYKYGISPLSFCCSLDYTNRQLVTRLMNIRSEPDYSNEGQLNMLDWLEKKGYLQYVPTMPEKPSSAFSYVDVDKMEN